MRNTRRQQMLEDIKNRNANKLTMEDTVEANVVSDIICNDTDNHLISDKEQKDNTLKSEYMKCNKNASKYTTAQIKEVKDFFAKCELEGLSTRETYVKYTNEIGTIPKSYLTKIKNGKVWSNVK